MSKVILSTVFLNVRNVRNFSVVASTKNWDVSSRYRPCPMPKRSWSIPVKSSSPLQSSYFRNTTARWCSTGTVPPALTVLSDTIPPPPGTADGLFDSLPAIPAPPTVVPPLEKVLDLAQNGEPTLQSIGLGGWWPRGMVQDGLMYVHVNVGLPWWGTIMLGACIMRCFMFPLTIKSQRASARMSRYMPQISEAYEKMTEARKRDDPYLVYKYAKQVEELQAKSGSPLANLLPGLGQAPFIFFFFSALREMSTYPVESFKTGGTLWFPDLTVTDSYYGLPLMTAVGLFAVLKLNSQAFAAIKFGRFIPIAAAPFSFVVTMYFTNAIGVYWVTASTLNFIQAVILRRPTIRAKLGLDPLVPAAEKKKKLTKGFFKDIKNQMENSRITREVSERYRLDAIAFERAGREPLKKTYKIDPTKNPLSKNT